MQLNDVLYAMADSLMEKVPKPFNPTLKFYDKPVTFKIGGRPPREIFYRQTMTFLTKLPPPVQSKSCSCQYLCQGDAAVIKCHSCSIYTPTNSAFYCQKCFDARHPWYRVPHIYTSIEKDESIEHTLKIAHRVSEAARYEQEGQEILKGIIREKERMQFIGDDEKVDNRIREYGRRAVALEDHITQLRQKLIAETEDNMRRRSFVMDETMVKKYQLRMSMVMDGVVPNEVEDKLQFVDKESQLSIAAPSIREAIDIAVKMVQEEGGCTESSVKPAQKNVSPEAEEHNSNPTTSPTDAKNINESDVSSLPIASLSMIKSVDLMVEQQEHESAQVAEKEDDARAVLEQQSTKESPTTATDTRLNYAHIANVDHKVTKIQALFRRGIARRLVSDMLLLRLCRVWSSEIGRGM